MVASASSRQPLHLLLIAAADSAVARLQPVFAAADKPCKFHRIDSADGMASALAEHPWDAALYLPDLAGFTLQGAVRQIEKLGVVCP